MIDLVFSNGEIFVFNVDHWVVLRKQYRIVGDVIGNNASIPALPVKLSPAEVLLLLQKEVVQVKEITNYNRESVSKQEQEKFENELLQAQMIEYRKIRRTQLESMIDKIVEKRRQLNDTRSAEEILNEEVAKSSVVNKDNMLWPILLHPEDSSQISSKSVCSDEILKLSTRSKSLVFQDLWEKGYYITGGGKFGGDYLVYLGDPLCYHAIFIVRCVEPEEHISPTEIVAFGRLGTSVKKRAVLASVLDGHVSYITINWIDS